MPAMGCLHLPFMDFRALLCVSSPAATTSCRCLSCALMTSSAVSPWSGRSQAHPTGWHVIVLISFTFFHPLVGSTRTSLRQCETSPHPSRRRPCRSGPSSPIRPGRCGRGCPRGRGRRSRDIPRAGMPAPGAPRHPEDRTFSKWKSRSSEREDRRLQRPLRHEGQEGVALGLRTTAVRLGQERCRRPVPGRRR